MCAGGCTLGDCASEWALLQPGLDALAPEALAAIRARAATMTRGPDGYVCPLLDTALGICPVYAQRPVACRTYGYYVARDKGLFCRDIEGRVASGVLDDVIWGSQAAVDRQLAADGEALPLPVWFDLREAGRADATDAP